MRWSHHDAVGLADSPQVDPTVLPSCGEQAARVFPQCQTRNSAGVSLKFFCTATREGQFQHKCGGSNRTGNEGLDSRSRHEILVVLAAVILVARGPLLAFCCCCWTSVQFGKDRYWRLFQRLNLVTCSGETKRTGDRQQSNVQFQ